MLFPFRLVRRLVAGAVAVVLLYLTVTFTQVWLTSRRDEARAASAIVVLGAAQFNGTPSKVLQARLDHAADLWNRRLASTIVVTGGKKPGDVYTEASAGARYLESRYRVPDTDVVRITDGHNSYESLAAAARVLRARHLDRVLLVSDPFHALRLKAIVGELHLAGYSSPTRTSPITGAAELRQMGRETVAVSLGRLIGYRRLMRVRDTAESR